MRNEPRIRRRAPVPLKDEVAPAIEMGPVPNQSAARGAVQPSCSMPACARRFDNANACARRRPMHAASQATLAAASVNEAADNNRTTGWMRGICSRQRPMKFASASGSGSSSAARLLPRVGYLAFAILHGREQQIGPGADADRRSLGIVKRPSAVGLPSKDAMHAYAREKTGSRDWQLRKC